MSDIEKDVTEIKTDIAEIKVDLRHHIARSDRNEDNILKIEKVIMRIVIGLSVAAGAQLLDIVSFIRGIF